MDFNKKGRKGVTFSRKVTRKVEGVTFLGTVTSYGFAGSTMLQSQNYQNCIRQEEGKQVLLGAISDNLIVIAQVIFFIILNLF